MQCSTISNRLLPHDPHPLAQRKLGRAGLNVSAIGLGCMGMSEFYGGQDEAGGAATIRHALDHGINFLDTADIYGPYTNEELVGRIVQGRRDEVVLATKGGIVRDSAEFTAPTVNNCPEYLRSCVEASLRRLGTDRIDLFYLHRHNPASAPIEEAVGALAAMAREGKILHVGLSEVSAVTLRRACAVHPIAALQTEYSLWSREPEASILPACRELGVGFVPYSPLGRGFLSGTIRRFEDFAPDDFRRGLPRFQPENFARNLELVRTLEALAKERGATPSQFALAWVLAQGEDVVPIPGTRRVEHLAENLEAMHLALSSEEQTAINEAFAPSDIAGRRYTDAELNTVGL